MAGGRRVDHLLPILNSPRAQTCVWMDAGVVAFRLCDRGFACEHCPFDAALRRDPRAAELDETHFAATDAVAWQFPPDRLYTDGHLWIQTVRGGHVRAGIDSCAARLLRPVRGVMATHPPGLLQRGDPLCTLVVEGGELPLRSPITGRVCGWNSAIDEHPEVVSSEPYGAGWLAELTVTRPGDLDGLLSAAAARQLAGMDARRFRRGIAFHLLSADGGVEPGLEIPFLEAAHRLVGPDAFVELARQLLH